MAIRRACTWQATITLPEDSENYEVILVTLSQKQQNLINKRSGDDGLTINTEDVVLNLTQEETRQFAAGTPALLQIRAYKSVYDAPGSRVWAVEVYDSLNTEVLP